MFLLNARGEMEYQGGKEDWDNAVRIAAACAAFREDDETEQTANEARSCYNCRYRRWTRAAFTCCKGGQVLRG